MKFVSRTDVGKRRKNNEDSIFSQIYDENTALFIVADGLGGYESGEVASSLLTKKISTYIYENVEQLKKCSDDQIKDILKIGLMLANDEIYRLEKTDAKYKGMGTTVVLVLIVEKKIYYLSVGDSRLYYIDKKAENIKQLTVDDTYVNELLKTKAIDETEAKTHPQKHVLTKAVGIIKNIGISVKELDKNDGYLVLCSDGITNMLLCKDILNCIKENEFDKTAYDLVDMANKNGGLDNSSVIIVKL